MRDTHTHTPADADACILLSGPVVGRAGASSLQQSRADCECRQVAGQTTVPTCVQHGR